MGIGSGGGFTPSNSDIKGPFRVTGSLIQLSSSNMEFNGILTGSIAGPGSFLGLTEDGRMVFTTPAGGGGSGDVEAGSTFTTAGVIMACDGDDKTIDEPGATLTTNNQGLTVSGVTKIGASAGSGKDLFVYTDGTAAHVGLQWDADGETEGILIGGADDHGVDLKFYGETAGKYMHWDMSGDELLLASSAKLSFHDAGGGENILATTDGTLQINAGSTVDLNASTFTVDASAFLREKVTIDIPSRSGTPSATDGSMMHFEGGATFTDNNTSADGTAAQFNMMSVEATALAASNSGVTTTDAATLFISGAPTAGSNQTITNAHAIWAKGPLTIGVNDTGHDVKFYGATSGQFMLWDESADELVLAGDSKLSFHDAAGGENIIATSNGHLEINAGTTLDATAPTVDVNASTAVTIDGPAVTVADSASGKPVLTVKTTNTTSGTSGELQFLKDAADTEDGEVLGQISFYGEDEGNNNTHFANIKASISESDQTDEAGKLELQVAESNGTTTAMTTGLTLEGEHATDGQIDVTIAAGADSTTTIAGDLEVTTDLKVSGDTSLHNEGSNCLLTLEGLAGANSAIQFKETNHYWSMGHRGSDNAFFIRDSLSTTGDIIQIEENAGDNLIYAKAGSLLGINTDAPTHTLTVVGTISGSSTAHVVGAVTLGNTLLVTGSIGGAGLSVSNNDAGTSNTILGGSAGAAVASGCNLNVIIGHEAGNDLSSGDNNVLIGYQAGDKTTDVDGAIVIGHGAAGGNLTAAADGTVLIGTSAGAALTTGAGNTAVGFEALKTNVDGDFNTAFGYQALETFEADADGHGSNSAVGYTAGQAVSTGTGNTILGAAAGDALQGGDDNIFIGGGAGGATTAGGNIICVGVGAGAAVMTSDADGSIFVGTNTGAAITTGQYNTAVGHNALDVDVAGDGSTAVGYQALTAQTGTDGTVGATAIGYFAGKMNLSGISSTFLGWKSGPQTPSAKLTGDHNTCVGAEAGGDIRAAGHSNTFVGSQAGLATQTGVENTCLGFNADIEDATATNQIVIGNNITGTKDNAVFIGNDSSHIENDYNADATWNHSSDIRQKTRIEDDTLGLSFINNIRPVTYQHKSPSEFPKEWAAYNADDTTPMGGGKTIHGFIAQEIKQALDIEGVTTFGGWSVGADGRQSMSFDALVMPLVNAVKELSWRVKELENSTESE